MTPRLVSAASCPQLSVTDKVQEVLEQIPVLLYQVRGEERMELSP